MAELVHGEASASETAVVPDDDTQDDQSCGRAADTQAAAEGGNGDRGAEPDPAGRQQESRQASAGDTDAAFFTPARSGLEKAKPEPEQTVPHVGERIHTPEGVGTVIRIRRMSAGNGKRLRMYEVKLDDGKPITVPRGDYRRRDDGELHRNGEQAKANDSQAQEGQVDGES